MTTPSPARHHRRRHPSRVSIKRRHSLTIDPTARFVCRPLPSFEQMANFNFTRERRPRAQPHQGSGAFGPVRGDPQHVARTPISGVSKPGAKTRQLIRFSTVGLSSGGTPHGRDPRGSPEVLHVPSKLDHRGNTPRLLLSFFARRMKCQHFIRRRSGARIPASRQRLPWDSWTRSPETAHSQVAVADWATRGKSRENWPLINGSAPHTSSWSDADTQSPGSHIPFPTTQRRDSSTQAEADRLAASNGHYHQRDLHEAIKRAITPADAEDAIMPSTKHELPVQNHSLYQAGARRPSADQVGKLLEPQSSNAPTTTAAIEQAAFGPTTWPGTGLRQTKMRWQPASSYPTTDRAPSVNYKQIPSTRPNSRCTATPRQGDTKSQHLRRRCTQPNSYGGPKGRPGAAAAEVQLVHRRRHGAVRHTRLRPDDDDGVRLHVGSAR